jgi:hypothetical protein
LAEAAVRAGSWWPRRARIRASASGHRRP